MPAVELSQIIKSFKETYVLKSASFTLDAGEFFFLLGPSGCGKSTLLRIIAGLETPDSGKVIINNRDVTELPAHQRGVGMVFQQYALWPHMTVSDNVAFALDVQKVSKPERKQRLEEALALVRLRDQGSKYPHQLSGGQQQRVSLARALAMKPSVLLLDEPLSNLDAQLRDEIRDELRELHLNLRSKEGDKKDSLTMIYVTHDREDALALATKVGIMHGGILKQLGTPQELYNNPHSSYVAGVFGDVNIIPCKVLRSSSHSELLVSVDGVGELVAREGRINVSGPTFLAVRPTAISLNTCSNQIQELAVRNGIVTVPVTLERTIFQGGTFLLECLLSFHLKLFSLVNSNDIDPSLFPVGSRIGLQWRIQDGVVLSE